MAASQDQGSPRLRRCARPGMIALLARLSGSRMAEFRALPLPGSRSRDGLMLVLASGACAARVPRWNWL